MRHEEYEAIVKLIKQDEKEGNIEHLLKLKEYLNHLSCLQEKKMEETIFCDPELESKKEILLTPMEDYFDEIKEIGPRSSVYYLRHLLYNEFSFHKHAAMNQRLKIEKGGLYDGQHFVCLAHFIQLTEEEVKENRGVGVKNFYAYHHFLKEKGLHFGTEISQEENERIIQHFNKKKVLECSKKVL